MNKSNELPSKRQTESVLPETKAKNNNFTQISNEVLLDERLSFKARGILALLLSRPKNWKIYINEIVERSNLDGKYTVQSGFKELKALGYIELIKVWNKETGKFEGTVYQLCLKKLSKSAQKNLNPSKNSSTVEKTDKRKTTPSVNPSIKKPDRPKTGLLNNTDSSNTKDSKTKIQQQQITAKAKNDDGVFLKMNQLILTQLQEDKNWVNQFIGQIINMTSNAVLTVTQFDLLLQHFQKTAIASGTTYKNIAAVKRHFFNWFNANLKKNALSAYINEQAAAPKKMRKRIATLIPQTNALLDKIYGQQCENEAHLYRCLQLLTTHLLTYEKACNLLEDKELAALQSWIADIQKVEQLVQRGQKAGQLNWFFAKAKKQLQSSKSTRRGNRNVVHQLSNQLSSQFATC